MALTVDFSKVSDGVEVGTYVAKVKKITKEEGKKAPYLKWELIITNGRSKGLGINHITTLKPDALFGLRDTLKALGIEVPKAAVKLDFKKLVGKPLGIEVGMREYKTDAGETREAANVMKVFRADKAIVDVVAGDTSADIALDDPEVDDTPLDDIDLDEEL